MARLRSGKTHEALKGKLAFVGIWAVLITTAIVTVWSQSNLLTESELDYTNIKVPKSLNGYKIVNISDIDNTPLSIVSKVQNNKPDVVILSGGYCDANGNYENSYNAVKEIAEQFPTYYVYSSDDLEVGSDILGGTGATNLTNASIELKNTKDYEEYMIAAYGDKFFNKVQTEQDRFKEFGEYSLAKLEETKDASISIFGLGEYVDEDGNVDTESAYSDALNHIASNSAEIKVCVTHNADLVDTLTECSLDFIVTGGTHGSSDSDSALAKGKYTINGKKVYVSGGIGSLDTTRIFNFPEFEIITLSDGTVLRQNPLEQVLNSANNRDPILNSDKGFKDWERSKTSSDEDTSDAE